VAGPARASVPKEPVQDLDGWPTRDGSLAWPDRPGEGRPSEGSAFPRVPPSRFGSPRPVGPGLAVVAAALAAS